MSSMTSPRPAPGLRTKRPVEVPAARAVQNRAPVRRPAVRALNQTQAAPAVRNPGPTPAVQTRKNCHLSKPLRRSPGTPGHLGRECLAFGFGQTQLALALRPAVECGHEEITRDWACGTNVSIRPALAQSSHRAGYAA